MHYLHGNLPRNRACLSFGHVYHVWCDKLARRTPLMIISTTRLKLTQKRVSSA